MSEALSSEITQDGCVVSDGRAAVVWDRGAVLNHTNAVWFPPVTGGLCFPFAAYEVFVRECVFPTWFKHTWLTGSYHICESSAATLLNYTHMLNP